MKNKDDSIQVKYVESDDTIEIDTGYGYLNIPKKDALILANKLKMLYNTLTIDSKDEEWIYPKGL